MRVRGLVVRVCSTSSRVILGAAVGLDELLEVALGERVLLEGEVLVGLEVVDPQLPGPRVLGGGLPVEELVGWLPAPA